MKLFFFLATLESAKLLPQQTAEPTTMSRARAVLLTDAYETKIRRWLRASVVLNFVPISTSLLCLFSKLVGFFFTRAFLLSNDRSNRQRQKKKHIIIIIIVLKGKESHHVVESSGTMV